MLSKAEIRACLAGQPTPVVPAHLFWFDGKFVDANKTEVDRMREGYTDDFVQCGPVLQKRAADVGWRMRVQAGSQKDVEDTTRRDVAAVIRFVKTVSFDHTGSCTTVA